MAQDALMVLVPVCLSVVVKLSAGLALDWSPMSTVHIGGVGSREGGGRGLIHALIVDFGVGLVG